MKKVLKSIGKIIGIAMLAVILFVLVFFAYINFPVKETKNTELGVTFSSRYSTDLGLKWKENFTDMLDELQVKKIRIPIYWDQVELQDDEYDFSSVDWQLAEAEKRDAQIILAVGQKVPRWPECFIPEWIKDDDQKRKEKLLDFIKISVNRYKGNETVAFWQVENEPFLKFGICPEFDVNLLDKEIELVRREDPATPIIVTDSGELSLWVNAAKRADVFGSTMYRTIYSSKLGYFEYPIGPRFFQVKYWLNKFFAGQENAVVIELQAEPWIAGWTIDGTLEEQFNSMNSHQLRDNVEFAQKVGFPEVYLWGVEWWYWLKTKQQHPELWETARELFAKHKYVY